MWGWVACVAPAPVGVRGPVGVRRFELTGCGAVVCACVSTAVVAMGFLREVYRGQPAGRDGSLPSVCRWFLIVAWF